MDIQYRAGAQRSPNSSQTQPTRVARSVLDRSYRHTTTGDPGYLLPLYVDEILPGDTVRLDAKFFAKLLSPLQRPVVDELILDAQAFFCPFRLVWDNWKKMMGERDNPDDHNDYLTPTVTPPLDGLGFQRHSIFDYMGIRTQTDGLEPNALFFRAYNRIWNDFYRDENLQDKIVIPSGDGPDPAEEFPLLKRGKRKDYLTGALPFVQKGDPVTIPLGGILPVESTGFDPVFYGVGDTTSGRLAANASSGLHLTATGLPLPTSQGVHFGPNPGDTGLQVDFATFSAITINDFRELVATQQLLERDARGGTRYIELLESHFGVVPEDSRLQRPEFLWAHSTPLMTHVVPSTTQLGVVAPTVIGALGAYMQSHGSGRGFTKSFTEHGALMVLVSVRAPLRYQQNVPRMFKRDNRFSYYWPDYALLGEQPVYNYEVFAQGTSVDDEVWGYQPRYEEYRRRESIVTGALRSDDPTSLDIFHFVQDFDTLPPLAAEFIEEDPPVQRAVYVTGEPLLMIDCNWEVRHVRPMPMFANPGLLRL